MSSLGGKVRAQNLSKKERASAASAAAAARWPRKENPPITERENTALAAGAKLIPLTKGKWAIVDAKDYPTLSANLWCAHVVPRSEKMYAVRRGHAPEKAAMIYMHRLILGCGKRRVDHKNGDGLDNRRGNLRVASQRQNMWNRGANKRSKTGIKGVYQKPSGRFAACIHLPKTGSKGLGTYATLKEAEVAYQKAAKELHGRFRHDPKK